MRSNRALGFAAVIATTLALAAPAASAPTAYTTNNTDAQTMDLGTGTVNAPIGASGIPAPTPITDIALSPAGVLYAVTDTGGGGQLYTIDTTTGAATAVGGPLGTSASNAGLTFTADGRLWMTSGALLSRIDTGTGVATVLANSGGSAITGLAGGCNGVLYAIRPSTSDPVSTLLRIENLDGVVTFTAVGTDIGVTPINSPKIAFDAAGTLWGRMTAASPQTFTINTSTGVGTVVASTTFATGLTIAPASCVDPPSAPADVVDAGGPRFVG